jgi:hypothetical protein
MSLDDRDLGLPFHLTGSAHFFEKGDAPMGKRRRVGGIVSTEIRDKQGEVIVQKGLDFSPYEADGWINDNHGKETDHVVGFPDGKVQKFEKGEKLPSGEIAEVACSYHEGFLLEGDDRADKLWKKAIALQGTGRSLGWSIEGKVKRREGPNKKRVAKAEVKHIALTAVPVGEGTEMEVLAKSIHLAETAPEDVWVDTLNKALSMGPATGPATPTGPVTGEGAGRVLAGESLEHDSKDTTRRKKKKKRKKGMSKAEALDWLLDRYPSITTSTAGRIVDLTLARIRARK